MGSLPGGNQSEGLVVRAAACLILTGLLSLGPTGCSLFKKNKDGDRTPSADGGRPPAQFPGSNDPLLNSSKVNPPPPSPSTPASTASNPGALLAGRVIDGLNRAPANTLIRCVNLDDKSAAPVDVPVTNEGYFTIQGLKSGTHYKLVARGKSGDKVLGGITYHTAPNIRVVIQVKEEYAGAGAAEGMPETLPKDQGKEKQAKPPDPPNMSFQAPKDPPGSWVPGTANPASYNTSPGQEPDLPVRLHVPSATNNPGSTNAGLAEQSKQWPPTLQLPRPTPPTLRIEQPKPALPPTINPAEARLEAPAGVPSCVLVGKQLVNFALSDINGEPWEFRSQRRGKLTLLDFWGTHCVPCKESIPQLVSLQSKHGSQGLEVIGVAYENGGSPQEQAYKILDVCKKTGANYRQLVGAGANCPVRNQFNVRFLPTMVLVDDQGWILWRHEGRLDAATAGELDRLVQRRLSNRGY